MTPFMKTYSKEAMNNFKLIRLHVTHLEFMMSLICLVTRAMSLIGGDFVHIQGKYDSVSAQ
jgi:hypothetical protein